MKKFIFSAVLLSGFLATAQETDSLNAEKLDEVIINALIKKDSDYTNKMPLKMIENPQVFSSINKVALENQIIYTLDDSYRNITGLQKMWNATGRAGDGGSYVILRGFPTNNSLRNGIVAPVTTTVDAINVENIEVLKGPAGTLYGSNLTSYGGVINRVTKKPYTSFGGNISFIGGGYNTYRVQADINTPITKDKKLLFRINTAYTNQGTFQKKDAKNTYFAFTPTLTYNATDKLQFNVEYELFQTRAISEQMFFSLSPNTLGGINNIKDLEEKGLDYKQSYLGDGLYTTSKINNIFGQIKYKINDNITSSTHINNSDSYSDGFNPYFSVLVHPVAKSLIVARLDQSTKDSKQSWFQIQQNFNLDYRFKNGMRNRTVIGFDYLKTTKRLHYILLNSSIFPNGAFDFVSLSGGDYSGFNGDALGAIYSNPANTTPYNDIGDLNTYSGYISNVFTPISGLNVMLGIRYESNNFKGGIVSQNSVAAYKQSAWSPKAGLVYEIIKNTFSIFGNYQNSFKSNGYYIVDTSGKTALSDPERANQFEGGFKANLLNGKINATVSYYDINIKNRLLNTGEYTPTFQPVQNQTGKIESKGVELEVNAYLVKGFSFIGGLAYNDSRDKATGLRPTESGSYWLANFNASYQFLDGSLKGLGFGVGGNYASENNVTGNFILPEYLVLNAHAYYDLGRIRIGVKVDNFTNEHYWIGYTTANPQSLLNAIGSITYRF